MPPMSTAPTPSWKRLTRTAARASTATPRPWPRRSHSTPPATCCTPCSGKTWPAPAKTTPKPDGPIAKAIDGEFGSFERFKKEFAQTAVSAEGSGWGALVYCRQTNRPLLMQIEKHNTNVIPMFRILLVLDVWEHAYYLDYKNDRARFVEGFWNIVNWQEVNNRLEAILK